MDHQPSQDAPPLSDFLLFMGIFCSDVRINLEAITPSDASISIRVQLYVRAIGCSCQQFEKDLCI